MCGEMISRDRSMVQLWDAASGRELVTLRGHTEFVLGVAFSPDGRRLATASQDGTVKLWDTATGQELLTLTAYTSGLRGTGPYVFMGVAFSPDGRRLAAISRDHTVRIWLASDR